MSIQYTANQPDELKCPVCAAGLEIRLARGRKSGKAFIMAVCPVDGRHIRSFINDPNYVRQVIKRLEARL